MVSRRFFGFVSLCVLGASLAGAQGNPIVGKLTAARNAQVSRGPAGPASAYENAKIGQSVREGYGVRTFRRSFAQITFTDGSAIRVNEQTDLVVQSVATLRKIRLDRGALWVRDENGSRTSVQTPVGSATARGTEFVVTAEGTVTVTEGEVELENKGIVVVVGPGETGGFGPDGTPQKGGVPTNPNDNWYEKGQAMPVPTLTMGGVALGVLGVTMSGGDRASTGGEPVPEPATMLALGMGAAGLLLRKRR